VERDEPGCSDKQNRVSSWEIETPESLFIFPSLTSGLKRPLQSGFLGKVYLGARFLTLFFSGKIRWKFILCCLSCQEILSGGVW
jgi:hypothetical protein